MILCALCACNKQTQQFALYTEDSGRLSACEGSYRETMTFTCFRSVVIMRKGTINIEML